MQTERIDTVVIGAAQAGLSAGYYLKKSGRSFVVLDANPRVGDSWRNRYDSLRLFTPAATWACRAAGSRARAMPPRPRTRWPTTWSPTSPASHCRSAQHTRRTRVARGRHLCRGNRLAALRGDNVIVASGAHREPRVPAIARELDPSIVQLHSSEYLRPSQLRDGGVLIVGAGNSGADIAMELVRTHPTWLSGPDRGHVPVDIDAWLSRRLFVRIVVFLGRHVLTVRTPMGRKARDKAASQGDLLVRVKPKQLLAAGIERGPKTDRRAGRQARARGRSRARRDERHLEHRVPPRPVLDRSADLR